MMIHQEMHRFCQEEKIPSQIFENVTSTNDLAKAEAMELTMPLKVYLCADQSAGRGRGSNTWTNSKSGTALLCSFSYSVQEAPQPIAAPLFGLATYRALSSSFANLPVSLKAPNDIYLKAKKCGGLLLETQQMGNQRRLIVGLGINIIDYPKDIPTATCLSDHCTPTLASLKNFWSTLSEEFSGAALACQASSLTVGQREELLHALNKSPLLAAPYTSVSPFADLASDQVHVSWKDL